MINRIDLYVRLSRDDDGIKDESNSITSQRRIIMNYIASIDNLKDIPVVEHVDDGYSGTNFERPAVKSLIDAVYKGEVKCIIVKDFSRFGRSHLEVGRFIEVVFPYYEVRFIAINDHYDSDNYKSTTAEIDVVFRNLMNALYSKDVSKKVKAAKRLKVSNGLNINSFAPYGYKKSIENKYRLEIDEPAAAIVVKIFNMFCNGQKPFEIAKTLNSEGILTPSAYKKLNGSRINLPYAQALLWSSGIVNKILSNEQYTGCLICNKVEVNKVGGRNKVYKKEDEWTKIPNAHPAIITLETWNTVVLIKAQGNLYVHQKPDKKRLLYKKVRCGHCGRIMRHRSETKKGSQRQYRYYNCETPRYTREHGCHSNAYYSQGIENAVKSAVKTQINLILGKEKLCIEREKASKKKIELVQDNITCINQEIVLLEAFKRTLYERFRLGKLSIVEYMKERENIQTSLNSKSEERDRLLSNNVLESNTLNTTPEFFHSIRNHKLSTDLNAKLVNSLVESVYVYNKDRIEVVFAFADVVEQI